MRVKPKQIIRTLKQKDGAIRKTARELHISPGTVINWRRRAMGMSAARNSGSATKYLLENVRRKSTRPKTVRKTSIDTPTKRAIVALRKERGYGADKITRILHIEKTSRTVHKILKDEGLTAKTKNYRRPRYQETTHMYLRNVDRPGKLQLDIKYVTPELSGLAHTTYLYALIDVYSRYKAGVILPGLDQALVIEALKYIMPRLPKELKKHVDFIQTDNGLEFQKQFLTYITQELNLSHHYIHKSSPNENAVIERSFRTDEEEFFWRIDRPKDLLELNAMYQQYMDDYNTFRPHLGIELMTPMEKLIGYTG